jgi:hypothetical protein
MGNLADINWVREDLVDVAPVEKTAPSRSPLAMDALGKAHVVRVEDFL